MRLLFVIPARILILIGLAIASVGVLIETIPEAGRCFFDSYFMG